MKLNTILLAILSPFMGLSQESKVLTDAEKIEALQKLLAEAKAQIVMLRHDIEIRDAVKFTAKYASGLCDVIAAEQARSRLETSKCGVGFKLNDKLECVK